MPISSKKRVKSLMMHVEAKKPRRWIIIIEYDISFYSREVKEEDTNTRFEDTRKRDPL